MAYYLLKRYISPDTHIILGLFDSHNLGKKYLKQYMKQCQTSDPFGVQGYHSVDFEKDITLQEVTKLFQFDPKSPKKELYVVSYYEEGMGQIIRKILTIFNTQQGAKELIKKLEDQEPEHQPSWYDFEVIQLNKPCFNSW